MTYHEPPAKAFETITTGGPGLQAAHLVLAQHGIRTGRRAATWPERLEAWAALHAPGKRLHIVTDQYKAFALPKVNMLWKNRRLAKAQAAVLAYWQKESAAMGRNLKISLVGHSNGCAILWRTALELQKIGVNPHAIVFLAPPLRPSWGRLGLKCAVENGCIFRAVCWCSPNDHVLHPHPKGPLGYLRAALQWPYGNAGRVGMQDVVQSVTDYASPPPGPVAFNRWFSFGHCDYFSADNEPRTFKTVIDEITAP